MKDERQKLEEAIAAQEGLRGTVDDAVIEATITTLREKLDAIEARERYPEMRRKLVTILFADTVESTPIVQHLDPEDVRDIFESALQRMAKRVTINGGRVTGFMGDGFKAVFGAEQAREDDPERAVRAGLEITATMQLLSKEFEKVWGIPEIKVRVGIHTGLVALGGITEAYDTMMGSTVHLASRLEKAAPHGGVLISNDTYRHIRGVFDVVEMEPLLFKGFDEPVVTYQVLRVKPRAFRTYLRGVEGVETHMVGRITELKFLQDALKAALQEGEGQVITILGEAGVGKSRLIYEFQNWIELLPDEIFLFKGRAWQESQTTPYSLLRDVFAFRFEILEDDPVQEVIFKFEHGFRGVFGPGEEGRMRAHVIGQLLGFGFTSSPYMNEALNDPQTLRNRGIRYLREFFETVSRQDCAVIFLEDIHWSDDSSLDAINSLSSSIRQFPLLIIGLARPSLYERRPYWGEGLEYHIRIEVNPLSKSESRQLVTEIFKHSEHIPSKLRELLVGAAEGNPYFIEELIKMLIDNGVIIIGAESWRVETDQLVNVEVPSTLTGVLQARLDRLPIQEKLVLQQASVVGRTFWDSTVKHINAAFERERINEKQEIAEHLTNLRGKEMIYRREESTFTDSSEFIFKHAILRDVTYDSVLKKLRRIYHQLVAEWLIQQSGERGGEYAGLIGEHLMLAGKKGEAAKFFVRAAQKALRGYANKEAEQFFKKALDLSPPLAEQVSILSGLGKAISRQSRYNEAASVWGRAVDISRQQKDTDQISRLYAHLTRNAWHMDNTKESLQTALEGLESAQDAPDSPGKVHLLHEAARAYYFNGENELAETYTRQAIKLADKLNLFDVKAEALSTLGALPGVPIEEKRSALVEAIHLAEENGMLLAANRAYNNLGTLYYFFLAEIKNAHDCFHKAAEIAKQITITHQEIYNRANLAAVLTDMGKLRDAQKQIELIEDLQKQIPDPESINLWVEKSRGFLTGQKGAWEHARAICQRGLSEAKKHDNLSFIYFFASYLTYLYLEMDRYYKPQNLAETLEIIQEAVELSDLGMGGTVWCRCFKLSVLIRLGNLGEARELISEIQELTTRQDFDPEYYFLLYSKAELAEAEGHLTEAISFFQDLYDYYANSDLQWEWARIALDMGSCYAKRDQIGDIARARDLFSQSSDLFSVTGATGYSQIAQDRLLEISQSPDNESKSG